MSKKLFIKALTNNFTYEDIPFLIENNYIRLNKYNPHHTNKYVYIVDKPIVLDNISYSSNSTFFSTYYVN